MNDNDELGTFKGILLAVIAGSVIWLLTALVFSLSAQAADPWDTTDKVLGATALTATVMDWSQTRYIARHPYEYHELNPTLPDHPSVGQVDAHFAGSIALGALIANWLPEQYRRYFLGGIAVIEIGAVAHNHSIGVQLRF